MTMSDSARSIRWGSFERGVGEHAGMGEAA